MGFTHFSKVIILALQIYISKSHLKHKKIEAVRNSCQIDVNIREQNLDMRGTYL